MNPKGNHAINFDSIKRRVRTELVRERKASIKMRTETTKMLEERSFIITPTGEEGKEDDVTESESGDDNSRVVITRPESIRDSCTVLLSCLHAWGVDLNIGK